MGVSTCRLPMCQVWLIATAVAYLIVRQQWRRDLKQRVDLFEREESQRVRGDEEWLR